MRKRHHPRVDVPFASVRLIVARCEVRYSGRLNAVLPRRCACSCSRPRARCSTAKVDLVDVVLIASPS